MSFSTRPENCMGTRPLILVRRLSPLFLWCLYVGVHGFEGWIDPDTPDDKRVIQSYADPKSKYRIVMSDEFETEGRTFEDGADPMWTALDKSDDDQTSSGRKSIHFYNSSMVYTSKGNLVIKTTTGYTKWRDFNPYKKSYETMQRNFKSGMIQSWNKFCFTGGIFEVSLKLPGKPHVGGLWPAVWLLGNLGRATYEASTNKLWPWSYAKCDRKLQKAQELSGCDVTEHYSFIKHQGRGATEIDILEVMPGEVGDLPVVSYPVSRPYTTMTLQLAPGIDPKENRPPSGTRPDMGFTWYEGLQYGHNVSINPFFYGTYLASTSANEPAFRSAEESYQCDAVSSMVNLGSSHFEKHHTYRLEWSPTGMVGSGYLKWYVDGEFKFGVAGKSLNKTMTMIPNEPSSLIFNVAVSTSWGFLDLPIGCAGLYDCNTDKCGFPEGFCDELPAQMEISSVRIYQNEEDKNQTIGCNPSRYPTAKFIKAKSSRYMRSSYGSTFTDSDPLKEVKSGTGRCSKDAHCSVSEKTKTGTCRWGGCRCNDGWVGPRCRVRDFKNGFPDFDADRWPTWQLPSWKDLYFLVVCGVSLGAILAGATVIVSRRRSGKYEAVGTHEGSPKASWF
jgi:beta-glucanase (GH16 family)